MYSDFLFIRTPNKDSHVSKQTSVYAPCSICPVSRLKLPKLPLTLVIKMYFKTFRLTTILFNWNHELSNFCCCRNKTNCYTLNKNSYGKRQEFLKAIYFTNVCCTRSMSTNRLVQTELMHVSTLLISCCFTHLWVLIF